MIIRLKRIYSYFIEALVVAVICYFVYEFVGTGLFFLTTQSSKVSQYMYMYALPIFFLLWILYFCFRSFLHGQSLFQKLFGIKCVFKRKRELFFKNVIDLCFLLISFFAVLVWNKSVGDYLFHISVIEESEKKNTFFYIMMAWFTFIPLLNVLAFCWRVNQSEESYLFHLNNSQTIIDHVGTIESFSFRNYILWTKYDKDGVM